MWTLLLPTEFLCERFVILALAFSASVLPNGGEVSASCAEEVICSTVDCNSVAGRLDSAAILLMQTVRQHYRRSTRVHLLARSRENAVLEVSFEKPNQVLILKASVATDPVRRASAIEEEGRVLRMAKRSDKVGGRHLIEYFGIAIVRGRERVPSLVTREAEMGALSSNFHLFGPEIARQNPEIVLGAWLQMAQAVRAVHSISHVHRDLKPANFVLSRRDGALFFQLIDFGLCAPHGSYPPGLMNSISGTLGHMSENQLRGGSARYEDDLFALLQTFREMLIGKSIWNLDPRRPADHVILRNVDEFGTYPCLLELPDEIAEQVHPTLLRMMETYYPSVDDLISEIEAKLRVAN